MSSYSIIYTGAGTEIILSQRWEAFSLGIEDYRILKLYEKKFGKSATKTLVNSVISNPGNLELADQVRSQMILAL